MDLLADSGEAIYYDSDPAGEEAAELLAVAAAKYGSEAAEQALLRAYFLEPENLTVLVALYRYLFYGSRLAETQLVAERAVGVAARRLGLDPDWRQVSAAGVDQALTVSVDLVRFYLSALRGMGYLLMRRYALEEALQLFAKVEELDRDGRFAVRPLIEIAQQALNERHGKSTEE